MRKQLNVADSGSAPSDAVQRWAIHWNDGVVPQWVCDIATALGEATGYSGSVLAQSDLPVACAEPGRISVLAWATDAKLFGASPALLKGGAAEAAVQGAPAAGQIVDLAAIDPDKLADCTYIHIRIHGLPACQLQVAIEAALSGGTGQIDIEGYWRAPGEAAHSVTWHVSLDELSRHRSASIAAEKIVALTRLLIARRGAVGNSMPGASPSGQFVERLPHPSWRAFRHVARRLLQVDQWAITVHRDVGEDELLPKGDGIDLIPPPDRFWADPFLVRDGARLWVFFEELRFAQQKGYIACASIERDGSVSAVQTVLEEPCHLSYPQVIRYGGRWFMLPESSARGDLVLYEAHALPGPWHAVARLLEGVRVADATLHSQDGRWWLTASGANPGGCLNDELHLFSAPDLFGPWRAAPNNPIRVDAASSRPAGPWFKWHGKWVRPVQDCRLRYGRALHLLGVERVHEGGLDETTLAVLSPAPESQLQCVHSYCRVGSDLAVDWLSWRGKRSRKPAAGYGDIRIQTIAQPPHAVTPAHLAEATP